jgi:hypothetical protein
MKKNKFEAYYYAGDDEDEPVKVKARQPKSTHEPKIMFARWGHMNPKRDKKKEKNFRGDKPKDYESMYKPPEHKGIYAFIWPYIEPFLAGWNKDIKVKTGKKDEYGDDIERFEPIKKFQHHGDIWTHFVDAAKKTGVGKEYKGDWVKVHTKDLPMLLGKVMAKDAKAIKKDAWGEPVKQTVSNPYKRGKSPTFTMSRDHLEVFIPGKVREIK